MKYYKMEGLFAQNGIFAPNNRFKGFVEVDENIYNFNDDNVGRAETQFFKGIQIDQYDVSQKSRLVIGGLTTDEINGETMYFQKVFNHAEMQPISYGLKANADGTYSGSWIPMMSIFVHYEKAEITKFIALTEEQVKEMKVKEFLERGYAETAELPPYMQEVVDEYEQTKKLIISGHTGTTKDKGIDKK